MTPFRLALSLSLLAPLAAAQDNVWVVAPLPGVGVDFTSLVAAVAGAQDGDTLLVKSGLYGSFGVNAKSLAITAAAGATVNVDGGVFIVGLQPGQAVSLQGLQLHGDPFAAALNLSNNDGDVWLLDCDLRGYEVSPPSFFESGTNAVWSTDCDSVVASGCLLVGGSSVVGETAWRSDTSLLYLYGSTLIGGDGHCETLLTTDCGSSGAALELDSGFLCAQSCTFTGGAAAPGEELCLPVVGCSCVLVAEGGPALSLGLGSPLAKLFDAQLLPGAATSPCGQLGSQVSVVLTGAIETKSGPGLTLDADTPLSEGDFGLMQFDGQAGDVIFLLIGFEPAHKWLSAWNGPLLIGGSQIMMSLGALPPSGNLNVPMVAPLLPPGVGSLEVLLQAGRVSAEGSLLANPAREILLDA